MKRVALILILILTGLISCKWNNPEKEQDKSSYIMVDKDDYELYKPERDIRAVMVLFGGFGESPKDIRREFGILELARENDIAVLLLSYNQKLWLEENEKHQLASNLQIIIEEHQLPINNIFIGGFSSGGVIGLLLSDFIIGMKEFYIDPKGVFAVDSPIDLSAVYAYCEKSIERNFSKPAVQESNYLLELLKSNLGTPKDDVRKYEDKSAYTLRSDNTSNLDNLRSCKIRFYTEPATIWWKKNRMMEYEELNACYIKKLSESLLKKGFGKVEYHSSTNKGYKANGDRHPHSWSIVDQANLVDWMLGR